MDQDVNRRLWRELFGESAESERIAADLLGAARFEAAPPGHVLVVEGHPAAEVVALAHGEASIGVTGEGDQAGAFVAERGVSGPCWLDVSSAWREDGTYLRAARADSPVQVLRMPVQALRRLTSRHPSLATHLLELLADEIGRLSTDVHDLLQKDAEARLASWLIRRMGEDASRQGSHEIQLTERKRQIAAQLGVKPETLSRLLRALTRKGLVEVFGYQVRVLDVEGLKALSAG